MDLTQPFFYFPAEESGRRIEMNIKKIASVALLTAIAIAGLFLFNYTPVTPVMGPATPVVAPAVIPVAPATVTPEVATTPQAQTPDVVVPTVPHVVLNQAAIDAAMKSALYTQVLMALALILGSSVLMFVRHYEVAEMKAVPVLMGAGALAIAAVMFWQDWVPSEVLPPAFALLAIAGAAAGPVLQLTAPDEKVLEELQELEEDLDASDKELQEAEGEIEKSLKAVEGLKTVLATAKAEAKAAGDKVAGAERSVAEASDRAEVAERSAAEALEARHTAETARATAVAEATALRGHAERAEAHSADVQVRLNAFEERKVADQATADLAVAEATLAEAKQRATVLQGDLQVAETEQQRLQSAHQSAVSAADAAWDTVDEAAKTALTTEAKLAEASKSSEVAAEAVANGVKILDADGLQQKLSDAEAEHTKASEDLRRLNSEARDADTAVGRLVANLQHTETRVSGLLADLETAKVSAETAKGAAEEAMKVAESAEIEAVAAERRFTALVAAEQQSAELSTKLAAEQATKEVLSAQNAELKGAVKDALQASGCTFILNRFAADEEVAHYRIELRLPQGNEVTFDIHIQDDEGEEMLFRTIPAGATASEPFEIDRGFNSKIHVLPLGQTAEALGTAEVVPYLVA